MEVGVRRSLSHCLLRSAWLAAALAVLAVGSLWAGGGPRNVVVVINTNSPESRAIGQYYQAARGIPASNICSISCPTQEVVTGDICETRIREPLRQFLLRPNLVGNVDYIVLTKGVPLSADYGRPASNGVYSIASILCAVDHPDVQDWYPFPYGPIATSSQSHGPLWPTAATEVSWSHALTFTDKNTFAIYHFYLVTRLDAFTVDQVRTMIDRGCHPAVDGVFALDKVPNVYPYNQGEYKLANLRLGSPTTSAYDYLVKKGFDVRFDSGTTFLANIVGLMGYFSWANHDSAQYTFSKFTSNLFVPGAIADTYWSYSGQTFTDPGTTNRNPLIADLFACGLCGAGAYVSEPGINTATEPNVLFDRYTKGYNMAESFYAACSLGFWKTVVIGDPLMAPYATPPSVSLDVGNGVLQDVAGITANAGDASGVSKVAFYLDDECVGTVTQAPFTLTLDTNEYAIGAHTIEAIAYENSPVATQGSAKAQVVIDNLVSTVDSIDHARDYADGQRIRMRTKVVIAGRDEIGDGFYMEEWNRTSAIKVLSGGAVNRGDVVTVTGTVSTVAGDRVMTNATVDSQTPGGLIPGALGMRLADLGGAAIGEFTLPVGRGCGARNTGLLVRVAAQVASASAGQMSITDGSVKSPVKVILPSGVQAAQPGAWVIVTGVCVTEHSGADLLPYIIARDAADIRIL